jgi:hypothetical protein
MSSFGSTVLRVVLGGQPLESSAMRRSNVFAAVVFMGGLSLGSAISAQERTPWGDPDLQGIWTNQTPVPLERPAALEDKAFFTPEEARSVEENALGDLLKRLTAEIATSGELNGIWLEAGNGRVPLRRNTSLVVDPRDGRIPYTDEGKRRWDATPKIPGPPLAANRPEDRALTERCIISDSLFAPNPFYNNFHRIVQAPGVLVIATETMHDTRVIPLDGRAHAGAAIRMWGGDSRGRWEGQTLVVETTNFNERRRFRGATEQLRMVERFTRVDADTIDYQVTVSDPATFTRPWTIDNTLRRSDDAMYEVACHEGNVGLAAILAGARAEEAAAR